jgi:hypothetical protein
MSHRAPQGRRGDMPTRAPSLAPTAHVSAHRPGGPRSVRTPRRVREVGAHSPDPRDEANFAPSLLLEIMAKAAVEMKFFDQPSGPSRVVVGGATLAELGPLSRPAVPEPLVLVVGAPRPGGNGQPPGTPSPSCSIPHTADVVSRTDVTVLTGLWRRGGSHCAYGGNCSRPRGPTVV